VPSASRIPCVRAFPEGMLGALAVRDGESVLELSHASVDINIGTGGQPKASTEAGSVTIRLGATADLRRRVRLARQGRMAAWISECVTGSTW
jgi:hypothetical protein